LGKALRALRETNSNIFAGRLFSYYENSHAKAAKLAKVNKNGENTDRNPSNVREYQRRHLKTISGFPASNPVSSEFLG